MCYVDTIEGVQQQQSLMTTNEFESKLLAEYRANPTPQLIWKTIQSVPGDIIIFVVVSTFTGVFLGFFFGLFIGMLAAVIPTLIGIFVAKKKWGSKCYRLYPDRIEEDMGVLSTSKRSVPMNNITEVKQQQSWFEGFFDVGDIVLRNRRGSSMKFKYLDNPDEVYREVQAIVSEHRRMEEDEISRKADAIEQQTEALRDVAEQSQK